MNFSFNTNFLKLLKPSAKKPKRIIGLDIGSHFVKAVSLQKENSQFRLCNFSLSRIVNDNSKKSIADTIEALNEETKEVNVSVSGSLVVVRFLDFPKMSSSDLKKAMIYEAEKYIPFNMNEVIIDCQIIEEFPDGDKMKVLLAACKRELIDNCLSSLQSAGLKVNLIDIDVLSLINAFSVLYPHNEQETVSLIHIGARTTSISILRGKIPNFARDIMIVGEKFAKQLDEILNIGPSMTDNSKSAPNKNTEEIVRIMKPIITPILNEIKLSFDYYESRFGHRIEKIHLSGGSCRFEGVVDMIRQHLGIETLSWFPTERLILSEDIDKQRLSAAATQLAVAVGLGLRD